MADGRADKDDEVRIVLDVMLYHTILNNAILCYIIVYYSIL